MARWFSKLGPAVTIDVDAVIACTRFGETDDRVTGIRPTPG